MSRLGPLTLCTSCMLRLVLHAPSTTWWLSSSISIAAFWRPGYLMRLCRQTQPCMMSFRISKSILHNLMSSGQPVVEDPLFHCHVAMVEVLHHVTPQGKGIITQEEVTRVLVIIGKMVCCRETYMLPSSRAFFNSEWLNIWASEGDPSAPTSTQRNL